MLLRLNGRNDILYIIQHNATRAFFFVLVTYTHFRR